MNQRWAASNRRFKTGASVLYDGLYTDSWGGRLLLFRGDRFPSHPEAGPTTWTFARFGNRLRTGAYEE
ncbi:hypothetical protein DFQ01_12230 [Paenibacillus cellulosilyticus]|uniref:Uncharacterized protein n=1 Tax=Paenibacillus cellulosilyticus TaxID=375489 RepID=A0A2V2YNT6_9BACL|nr:hypothetical protein [Paenibacillus cellulosilyticus]PWV97299.1 hypothetical protein DFQ01_12230 [Paenibacillus cellulosilyticus]QKS47499.1 hypothetical protein HUB94_24245 [Paenibacillus cellulosilyticus]